MRLREFPSSFGRGVPDQGPLTVEQSHAARPSPEISTSQPEASSGPNRRARRIMRSAHIMETLSTETHKPSNSKAFYQFPE